MGQKTDNNTSAMVGSHLMNKMNFTGVAQSTSGGSTGYQPRMYGQRLGNDSITDGGQSDRSFASKFGNANAVSASVDISSNRFATNTGRTNYLGMSTQFG